MALTLRRADAESAVAAVAAFLEFWRSHGQAHFREEEEILLPAYAAHADAGHPLVVRVLVDHVEERELFPLIEAALPADAAASLAAALAHTEDDRADG